MGKAKKASTAKLESMSGYDPKNGQVTLNKEGKGYRVTSERVNYNEFHATKEKAVVAYNHYINNSQRV